MCIGTEIYLTITMIKKNLSCRLILDSWLSDRLGKPAFKYVEILKYDRPRNLICSPAFVSASIAKSEKRDYWRLVRQGFIDIGENIVYSGTVNATQFRRQISLRGLSLRPAREKDKQEVKTIAETSLIENRFSNDHKIDQSIACKIKGDWAEAFFTEGRGLSMTVAEIQSKVVGFSIFDRLPKAGVLIDLIAVKQEWQGNNIGGEMIKHALKTVYGLDTNIVVGTFSKNEQSQKFYNSLGLVAVASRKCMHLHT